MDLHACSYQMVDVQRIPRAYLQFGWWQLDEVKKREPRLPAVREWAKRHFGSYLYRVAKQTALTRTKFTLAGLTGMSKPQSAR